ncbi:MAG: L-histidine N(alpha)-methyltransferase [Leptolyngbya sp. SIO3F4]|nr:L-histidine N(alpha)-methyltransferase [Leptolyngbya sp. SIO3F4]
MSTETIHHSMVRDVLEGLQQDPKRLPSKYFYDEEGDKLFQAIMNMPEYYLTNSEYEVFTQQKEALLKQIGREPFNLIEFGAGDGYKTKVLLNYFLEEGVDFRYMPVDISDSILQELASSLQNDLPNLDVQPLHFEYFEAIRHLNENQDGPTRNVILFLGSNIGNFTEVQVRDFLKRIGSNCRTDDMLLIGVDLQKDPDVILRAYNDPHGITAAFNLNLLERFNRELDTNFVVEHFKHYALYHPETGEARSYLISLKDQEVYFPEAEETIRFQYAEPIHTEISRKYTLKQLEQLARESGFRVVEHFLDCRHYFVDSLWQKQQP